MRIRFIKIVYTAIIIFLSIVDLQGQIVGKNDSLVFFLDNIKSKNDTTMLYNLYGEVLGADIAELMNPAIYDRLERLNGILEDQDYCDFSIFYFNQLIELNTPETNEKAIELVKKWIDSNESKKSKSFHYACVIALRQIRLPFRNNGKLNEAIQFYLDREKKYLAENDSDAISITYNVLSGSYSRLGMLEKAKYYQLKSIDYLNDSQEDYEKYPTSKLLGKSGKVNRFAVLGGYYVAAGQPAIAEEYLTKAINHYHEMNEPMQMSDAPYLFLQLARTKTLEKNDSSSQYYQNALEYLKRYESSPLEYAHYYQELSNEFFSKNLLDSAMSSINKTIKLKEEYGLTITSYFGELLTGYHKSRILIQQGFSEEAIALLKTEIEGLKKLNSSSIIIKELILLSEAYLKIGDEKNAYSSLKEAFEIKQRLIEDENNARSISFETEKMMQENELKIALLDEQNRTGKKISYYLYGIVALLILFLIALAVFYLNKKKNNKQLSLNNRMLSDTIQQLKETQTQLIQSEKMASLGELTAGIAHEIQNPLNFVNNFSEVNKELLMEMKDEIEKGNYTEVNELLNDIVGNEDKINHHGKRADAIVKGMLQHSRRSSGIKEPVDINILADEYVRLAYHGLRAKDKTFNATIKTHFDQSIGKVNALPQELGRVILNLMSNAFYVVDKKKKSTDSDYEPTVSISTKAEKGFIEIRVKDNGNGMSQQIMDKIFQPFYTTKPTGEGTGLGLSLSYDIITKSHSGELLVDSKEGEGAEFIVRIPQ